MGGVAGSDGFPGAAEVTFVLVSTPTRCGGLTDGEDRVKVRRLL